MQFLYFLAILFQRGTECPPSTANICPVTQEDSSEAKKRAAAAWSLGRPARPRGMSLIKECLRTLNNLKFQSDFDLDREDK